MYDIRFDPMAASEDFRATIIMLDCETGEPLDLSGTKASLTIGDDCWSWPVIASTTTGQIAYDDVGAIEIALTAPFSRRCGTLRGVLTLSRDDADTADGFTVAIAELTIPVINER